MDPKEHAERLVESAKAGLEKALAEGKVMTVDSIADAKLNADGTMPSGRCELADSLSPKEKLNRVEQRLLKNMSPEDRKIFMERRAKIKARLNPNFHKAPKRPGPNEPCPCGRTSVETGKRLKFKKCCGSVTGDLHFFVADITKDEPLMNDEGLVLVFKDVATASAAARAKGWLDDPDRKVEVVSLNPDKYKHFQMAIPHVLVTAKEFEVGDKVEDKSEDPKPEGMGTMFHQEPCPHCSGEPCEHVEAPLEMPTLTTADEGS